MNRDENVIIDSSPDESSGFLLWQVTNLWQREIKKALKEFDLTHSQFSLLASTYWFKLQNKEATQTELSSHTKIDTKTTSSVLKTLQKKGLINRKENTFDTRTKNVELTEGGEKTIKLAIRIVDKFDAKFFKPLSKNRMNFNENLMRLLDK